MYHAVVCYALSFHCVPELTYPLLQADDELDLPYLAGFEWDKEECYTRFIVHQKATGAPQASKSKKKKGNAEE